jgi:S1-C subfamily serine protease
MRQELFVVLLAAMCCLSPWTEAAAGAREAAQAYNSGDYATVLKECESAAKAGDPICEDLLGLLYSEGKGVKADPVAAARWFRLSAEQGNPLAAYNLGIAYENGRGVAKDLNEAVKWYTIAAEKGIPYAQTKLGLLLITDHSDWKNGLKWLRPAAAQGVPAAQVMLALAYELGAAVKRNGRLAVKWYEEAADHGFAEAQSRLAALYERGQLVEADPKEAYFWYAVALRDPKDSSRKNDEAGLKRTAAQLSKRDLDEAAALARDWRPKEVAIGSTRRTTKPKSGPAVAQGPQLFATGSGFYVTRSGHLLTNNHVVAQCREVRITVGEAGVPAKVLGTDPDRDLALLQAPQPPAEAVVFRADPPRLGENVVVVGFPLAGLLSSDAIVTSGIVSALAGARNDRRQLQISAPIQPGNSGGPTFDPSGHVVGVAVATLNTMRLAQAIGAIPENINFAVKAEEARQFLSEHGIAVQTAAATKELSVATIADQALKVTVRLECWK